MREAGVPACEAFHVRVNMNGEYYGLHAIIEQVDDVFLKVKCLLNGYNMHWRVQARHALSDS